MRFLLVEQTLKNRQLMDILKEEGHEVALLSPIQDPLHITYNKPMEALEWHPDVAVFIEPGMGELARAISTSSGVKVFNGSIYRDYINNDPDYANVLASRVQVPVMPIDNGGLHLRLAGVYSGKYFVGPPLSYSLDNGLLRDNPSKPVEAVYIHQLSQDCPLIEHTFIKLNKLFTALQFCGIILIDVQVDPSTGLPHIHRMSVNLPDGFLPAFIAGLDQELGKFLHGVASGKKFNFSFTPDVSGSVKVTLPPYPHHHLAPSALVERTSLPIKFNNTYWADALPVSEDTVETQGPVVGYSSSTASFDTLPYVLDTLAKTFLDELPEAQWRSDTGKELATSLAYCADLKLL